MTTAEVLVPLQPAISITVTIAPQVANGLHSRVQSVLSETADRTKPKDDRRAPRTVVNTNTGTVRGPLFQIGHVEGGIHHHGDR